MTTALDFNLRDSVKRVLADLPVADPHATAEKVLDQLSDHECRLALAIVLPEYVRGVSASQGSILRKPNINRLTTPQRVSSWYGALLVSRTFTGSEWKFLRDCTSEDLLGAAEQRYRAAAESQAEGERFTALAQVLKKKRRQTVGQLSEDELRNALGDA